MARPHLTNLLSSAPFGVLMQCVFAASLGTLFAAIYFRTGNLWVTVFLHGAMDIASMLVGGLYGTEDVAETISGYDASMMLSILIYLIPTLFLLRKKEDRRGPVLFQILKWNRKKQRGLRVAQTSCFLSYS